MRAGQRGRRVLLIDHAAKAGAKILISGGGRCNFTNANILPSRYLSQNPHFCVSALKSYTQHDFIQLVEKHKIAYHEKTLGQLFCDGSAQQIIDMLLNECAAAQVETSFNTRISNITKPDQFHITLGHDIVTAPSLVLATGGLSIPKLGATGFSYQIAEQFNIPLTEIRPALVPLTFDNDTLEFMRPLAGVSLPITAQCGKQLFAESMIFTHRGLSGPAILQISSYWREGMPLSINLMPDQNAEKFLRARKHARQKAELKTILSEALPQRLAQSLATSLAQNFSQQGTTQIEPTAPVGTFNDAIVKAIAAQLNDWRPTPNGCEGYAKAEVTLGGISTHALSSKTMEANAVKGLYVIGEAVDVTGWLGGYNFQWAWSSAWAAGSAV
jgi:predicted Rossmann fold flavoprotein